MFYKKLVHAVVGGKDVGRGTAEFSVNIVLSLGHGPLLPVSNNFDDLIILPGCGAVR